MKGLRRFIDKIKPQVEEGGKFPWLHSTFEAFETFLFVPNKVTFKGSHIRDGFDMKRGMAMVVMATIPALLFGMFNVGVQHYLSHSTDPAATWKTIIPEIGWWPLFWYGFLKVLPIVIVSYVVGLGIEFAFAQGRKHEVNEGYLVSGMLIPLIVPPDIPLWMVATATVFAVIIGKEVFGGTGMNILNPALTARAFLFFSYPKQMSGDIVWISEKADAYSGATPLGDAMTGVFDKFPPVSDMFLGFLPGSVGETSTLLILFGGLILLFTGVGSARIMFSVFIGGYLMGLLLNLIGAGSETMNYLDVPAHYHLMLGGFAFGAVFMATDPVTAAQTGKGKIIYGLLTGVLCVLIRVFNTGFPEGMMLAILFMNIMAPLIDHYVVQGNIKKRLKRAKIKA